MYSCLAELRESRRDLSRRRHNLGNSRLSRASWHSSLGLKGVGSKPSYMSHSYKSIISSHSSKICLRLCLTSLTLMFSCSLRGCRLHLYLFSLSVIVSSPSSLLKLILNLAESCDHPPDAPNLRHMLQFSEREKRE